MSTFLVTLMFFAGVMALMAVGVIFGSRPLKGSCGGLPGKDCSCSATQRRICAIKKAYKRRMIQDLEEEYPTPISADNERDIEQHL